MMKRYDILSALSSRLSSLAVLLLLSLFVFSGCEKKAAEVAKPAAIKPEATKPGEMNLKEIRLAAIPEDYDKWGNITFSSDGRQVFYRTRKKAREFIVVSSTGGENTGPAYERIFWLVASLDGRRFAFGGEAGGKKHLVVDNKEHRDLYHEEVAPRSFSSDGRFVACEVGGLKENKWFIVVSDGENEVYRSQVYPHTFRAPVFSPDSRLLVYELGEKNKRRIVFFLDLVTKKIIMERLYTDYETGSFSFNSDSSRVIYDVKKEGKNFLVMHDFALDEEKNVELPTSAGQFVLSPDGEKIAYTATKEGKYYLIVCPWESPAQGKESGPYEAIVSPVFSSDGAKIAYPAMKVGKWVMVVSAAGKPAAVKEGLVYDMVVTPVFSPDGRRIAYRARKGTMEAAKRFIVVADSETGKVIKEGRVGDEIWPPVWSADGKAAAYGAKQGRELWWRVEAVE